MAGYRAASPPASTTQAGLVQLAANNEVAAGKAVQANDSRLSGGAVTSVNGQTGAVELDAGDVGADEAGSAAAALAAAAALVSAEATTRENADTAEVTARNTAISAAIDASLSLYGAIRPDGGAQPGIGLVSTTVGTVTPIVSGKYPASNIVASGAASQSSIRSTTAAYSMEQALTFKHSVISDAASLASSRYWMGLSATIGTASKPTSATAALVFDIAVSPNWQLCTYDGSAGSCDYTDTGLAVVTGTTYEAELVFTSTTVAARIRVRGGAWSTTANYSGANKPAASTKMYFIAAFSNRTAAGTTTLTFLGASFSGSFV